MKIDVRGDMSKARGGVSAARPRMSGIGGLP